MLQRRKSYIRIVPRETHKNDKEAGYSQWFYLSWEVGETQLLTRIFKIVFYNLHFLTHCVFCNGIVCLSLLIATNQTNKMEIQTKKWKSKPTNPKQMEIQTNQPTAPRGQAALRKIDLPLKKTPTDATAENVCKKTQINSIVQTKPTNQTVQGKRSQTT